MAMQDKWKTMLLFFFVLACGAKHTHAQETGNTQQQEAIRKLETRMDELRSQMDEIRSELDAIRGTKVPPTGSIESKPPHPPLVLSPDQRLEAAGQATRDH